ncbi:transposase [Streptomyces sp. 3211]|uniref:transposase n=1 Tax=Streptomyces sp. 3211 TaxID=1964449 RepID=UPI0009A4E1FC
MGWSVDQICLPGEWSLMRCGTRIDPLMPADPVRGRRWADHRHTLGAIAWKYCPSSPWRDPPDELGSFQTVHKRLIRWAVTTPGRRSSPPSWASRMPTTTSTASGSGLHARQGLSAHRRRTRKECPAPASPQSRARTPTRWAEYQGSCSNRRLTRHPQATSAT